VTNAATVGSTASAWTSSATLPTWSSQTDGTYTVQATATDKVGNSFTGAAVTFTLDSTNPVTASVTTPADGATYNATTAPTTFTGKSADNIGGSGLNVNTATYTLQRPDGQYWNGTAWQIGVSNRPTTHVVTTGSTEATWTSNALGGWVAAAGTIDGTYTVQATTTDKAGNTFTGAAITFTLDRTAPTVTVDSISPNPTNAGTTVTWHANENGSYSVRVGGTSCTTGTVVDSGTYNSQPATVATTIAANQLAEGSNTVRVCVTDAVTNQGSTTATVTKDTTAPGAASVIVPANNGVFRAATVPAAFSGSAADNAGGVGLAANSTTFTLQRNSDGNYWNGSGWQASAFSLSATNAATAGSTASPWTSSATLPTWSSQADGTYTVQATATDKVGNSFTGAAVTFRLDSTNPVTASVTTPADGSLFRAATVPPTFSGSVADNSGGAGLAANSTRFTLQRGSDNFYWTGAAWQAAFVSLAATNTATTGGAATTWTDNAALPNWANQPDGTYTVRAIATDAALNSFTGPANTFTLDRSAPSVTINQAAGQPDPTLTSPINFTVVFSERINLSSFTSTDVVVTGTASGTKTVTVTQIAPNGTTFNVAVSGMTSTGTVIASIPANSVSDPAGNTNAASTSTDNQVQFGHSTTTTITCTLSQIYQTRSTTCTATVTDISPGASSPDGTVSFTTSAGAGNFTPTSCTLGSPVVNSSSCSVTYNTATSSGTTTLTASYAGNITHGPSSGTTTLDVLPPRTDGDAATGGTVYLAGGDASGGAGLIETWWLSIQGNSGSYTGTGMGLGGGPQIGTYHPATDAFCTFEPPVDNPNQYLPNNCVIPAVPPVNGTVQPATDPHCVFEPPVFDPDQYLDSCLIPATSPVTGTYHPPVAEHCDFSTADPPVGQPWDQYLPDCIVPGIPPVPGDFVPADPLLPSCDFSTAVPPVDPPWDQYLGTTPACLYPGADPTFGTENTVVTGSDVSMDE
jgi:hypothetical protein